MTSAELTTQEEVRDLTPLQIFFVKTTIVTVAAMIVMFSASYLVESLIGSR